MDKKNFSVENIFSAVRDFCKTRAGLFLCFILFVVIVYLPLLYLLDYPSRDAGNRYAPMAEAFARGDFDYAFHPRCQMLHTSVAGVIVYLTGCNGFRGCQFASFLFYLLSAFPLFFLCLRIFGEKIARGTLLILAFSPLLIDRLAVSGLRDAGKMFLCLLIAHAFVCIVQERQRWLWYIYAGIGCGLCVCLREDMVLLAAVILFLCGLLDRAAHRWIWRSMTAVLCMTVISFSAMLLNYVVCGFFIPGSRFFKLFVKFFNTEPTIVPMILYAVIPGLFLFFIVIYVLGKLWEYSAGRKILIGLLSLSALCLLCRMIMLGVRSPESSLDFVRSLVLGLYPLYASFAAIGIFLRIREKQWRHEETCLAILFAVCYLLPVIQMIMYHDTLNISSRYLFSTSPLLWGWSWFGIERVCQYLYVYLPFVRPLLFRIAAFAVTVILLLYCAYRREINKRIEPPKIRFRQALDQISSIVRSEKSYLKKTKFHMRVYRANRAPFVYFDCSSRYTVSAYCGGGSMTRNIRQMDLFVTASGRKGVRKIRKRLPRIVMKKVCGDIKGSNYTLQIWRVVKK